MGIFKANTYFKIIDPQALLVDCEKKCTRDELSVLTQYLHNSRYVASCTRKRAWDFVLNNIYNEEPVEGCQLRDSAMPSLFDGFFDVPFPAPEQPRFTFIDLFAGMGGFRLAMQAQGGKCVFSSEWNKYAQRTYLANFGDMPFGDITQETTKSYIPEKFDVLCAGFPCQPFSIAGVSKKNI